MFSIGWIQFHCTLPIIHPASFLWKIPSICGIPLLWLLGLLCHQQSFSWPWPLQRRLTTESASTLMEARKPSDQFLKVLWVFHGILLLSLTYLYLELVIHMSGGLIVLLFRKSRALTGPTSSGLLVNTNLSTPLSTLFSAYLFSCLPSLSVHSSIFNVNISSQLNLCSSLLNCATVSTFWFDLLHAKML